MARLNNVALTTPNSGLAQGGLTTRASAKLLPAKQTVF